MDKECEKCQQTISGKMECGECGIDHQKKRVNNWIMFLTADAEMMVQDVMEAVYMVLYEWDHILCEMFLNSKDMDELEEVVRYIIFNRFELIK